MTHLRRRMAEDMQVRNLSPCTQETYIQQVSLFARHFGKSPELLGPEEIRENQVHPAAEKRLAPGSIGVAVAALRFLYGVTLQKDWSIPEVLPMPRQPAKLPVAPSPEEVVSFLDAVHILRNRVVLTTCYAAGLRISEAISLRPTDIDSRRMVVRVEEGKGGKDRCVMLSRRLLETLRDYWRRARRPAGEWRFSGMIPGRHLSRNVPARACQKAYRAAGLYKRITPHSLRHNAEFRIIQSRACMISGSSCVLNIFWEGMRLATRNSRAAGHLWQSLSHTGHDSCPSNSSSPIRRARREYVTARWPTISTHSPISAQPRAALPSRPGGICSSLWI